MPVASRAEWNLWVGLLPGAGALANWKRSQSYSGYKSHLGFVSLQLPARTGLGGKEASRVSFSVRAAGVEPNVGEGCQLVCELRVNVGKIMGEGNSFLSVSHAFTIEICCSNPKNREHATNSSQETPHAAGKYNMRMDVCVNTKAVQFPQTKKRSNVTEPD